MFKIFMENIINNTYFMIFMATKWGSKIIKGVKEDDLMVHGGFLNDFLEKSFSIRGGFEEGEVYAIRYFETKKKGKIFYLIIEAISTSNGKKVVIKTQVPFDVLFRKYN